MKKARGRNSFSFSRTGKVHLLAIISTSLSILELYLVLSRFLAKLSKVFNTVFFSLSVAIKSTNKISHCSIAIIEKSHEQEHRYLRFWPASLSNLHSQANLHISHEEVFRI